MHHLLLSVFLFSIVLPAQSQSFDRVQVYSVDRIYTFQDHHLIFGKNNISLSLLPLINRGFEISYDRRIVERHWVKLAPIYFRMQDYRQTLTIDLKNVQGYGVKLQHKYFPYANTNSKIGIFLGYGPTYQKFELETKNEQFLSFNKIGVECVIGVRKVFFNVFYFEFFAGLATNYLTIENDDTEDAEKILRESSAWLDYTGLRGRTGNTFTLGTGNHGVTGNFMTLGFSLGVLF